MPNDYTCYSNPNAPVKKNYTCFSNPIISGNGCTCPGRARTELGRPLQLDSNKHIRCGGSSWEDVCVRLRRLGGVGIRGRRATGEEDKDKDRKRKS